jgi:hypothetical protein
LLPSRHVDVGANLPVLPTVFGVDRRGVVGADPLTDLLARALAFPLRELYAVLVRVGVVEIVDEPEPDPKPKPHTVTATRHPATVA